MLHKNYPYKAVSQPIKDPLSEEDRKLRLKSVFFEALNLGHVDTVQEIFAAGNEYLAKEVGDNNIPAVVAASHNHHNHGHGIELLDLLALHGADFNVIFNNIDPEMVFTPLCAIILNAPFNNELYDSYIKYGADVHHETVTNIIEHMVTQLNEESETDPSSMLCRYSNKMVDLLNKIKILRNEETIKNYKINTILPDAHTTNGQLYQSKIEKVKIGYDKKLYISVNSYNNATESIINSGQVEFVIEGKVAQVIALKVMIGEYNHHHVRDRLGEIGDHGLFANGIFAPSVLGFDNFIYYINQRTNNSVRLIDQDVEEYLLSNISPEVMTLDLSFWYNPNLDDFHIHYPFGNTDSYNDLHKKNLLLNSDQVNDLWNDLYTNTNTHFIRSPNYISRIDKVRMSTDSLNIDVDLYHGISPLVGNSKDLSINSKDKYVIRGKIAELIALKIMTGECQPRYVYERFKEIEGETAAIFGIDRIERPTGESREYSLINFARDSPGHKHGYSRDKVRIIDQETEEYISSMINIDSEVVQAGLNYWCNMGLEE